MASSFDSGRIKISTINPVRTTPPGYGTPSPTVWLCGWT